MTTARPTARPTAPRDRAAAAQRQASDPNVSAFVSASAGSGKTRVLTDRLLRLMLGDVDTPATAPERILCLTYTRAAAAEMALRLRNRLGRWIGLDDAALEADLRDLGLTPDAALCTRARRLFAQVLDVPGGMRIGTIHAFCQSLLRRFPLEAALTPHFKLVEDRDAAALLRDSREDALDEAAAGPAQQALQTLVGLVKEDEFATLVNALLTARARFSTALHACGSVGAMQNAQYRVLDLADGATEDDLLAEACTGFMGERDLRDAARVMAEYGTSTVKDTAARILAWLDLPVAERARSWDEWRRIFLTDKGEPRAERSFAGKDVKTAAPDLYATCEAEALRIVAAAERLKAVAVAQASAALIALAAPVLDGYAARKTRSGALDYADMIALAAKLLHDPGAAFVLYKLDGGLDHILLDEVQDTAPEQWQLTAALSGEFFAGFGAQDRRRTIFAVGDRKQSIYSFQGADPSGFDAWRETLGARTRSVQAEWCEPELDVSFRSTEPVLRLTDAVFADPDAAQGVVPADNVLEHIADRAGHAGRVELWPLTRRPERPEAAPWSIPERNLNTESAPQALANTIADWIARQLADDAPLHSRGRPLRAGDILVLVRTRGTFVATLVRALKTRGVPVAGLDRMTLTEQPAVQDLLALADVLLLPEDDLSLASVLTSPLGNIGDDSLMALALGRTASLWHTLQHRAGERADWQAAHDFLAALRARTDYVSPHTLFSETLGPLGGRARLLARLGPEAAEPLDEFLNAALNYARTQTPSLQGFVHTLRNSAAEVKREAEATGDAVRVMTVHGAKGLQAPLVILPDTTGLPRFDTKLVWLHDGATQTDIPLWSPAQDMAPPQIGAAQTQIRAAGLEEYNRLLYVALTRAEDRLIVCGWQRTKTEPGYAALSWYDLVQRGFDRLGATAEEDGVRSLSTPQTRPPEADAARQAPVPATPLPAWAGAAPVWRAAPPPVEPAIPRPLAPSRPEGAQHGPPPAAAAPLAARDPHGARFARGLAVHTLLQHLPDIPAAERPAAALRHLRASYPKTEAARIAAEVLAVMDHPDLGALFGPTSRAEVPLTGLIGQQVIGGVMDRIAVLPGQILMADFKTSREPPENPADAPVAYLRQMAAYRAVLRGVFPGRAITCVLIWTRAARVMVLPDSLLDRHAPA